MTPTQTASVAACTTCIASFGVNQLVAGAISGLFVFIVHHASVFITRKLAEHRNAHNQTKE